MTDTNRDGDGNDGSTPDHDVPDEPDGPSQSGDDRTADGGRTASAPASVDRRNDRDGGGGRDIRSYVQWAAFGILCLLALVATFRFYFAASEAIRVWFSPDFVPVFQAVFNLVVLVASAVGISLLVRRIA
ncbi:hypothetical protein [Halosimplex salinum]|uniref:hypothetical protein n=1 Tax=Halosimplex salinum TaxID=1710538 RepID=UPI000F47B3AE|nr:hypothetical protein [Halosimplex salinum]